jgi:transposase
MMMILRGSARCPIKSKETVAFLGSIPLELRASSGRVGAEMYEGYTNSIKEEVAQARMVIDRIHVAKAYRECDGKRRKTAFTRIGRCIGACAQYSLFNTRLSSLSPSRKTSPFS